MATQLFSGPLDLFPGPILSRADHITGVCTLRHKKGQLSVCTVMKCSHVFAWPFKMWDEGTGKKRRSSQWPGPALPFHHVEPFCLNQWAQVLFSGHFAIPLAEDIVFTLAMEFEPLRIRSVFYFKVTQISKKRKD